MNFVENAGVRLHVEVEGSGDPVTVYAHGLTNSCRELAMLTPMMPGTNVRFCFRGHGHSDAPEFGYRFADFAGDLDAVATSVGATRAVGTSLGAGAICNLLISEPDRFERIIFLLPAAVDLMLEDKARFLQTADLLESLPKDEAIEAIMGRPDAVERYSQMPWMREMAAAIWEDVNPHAAARAIREVLEDPPVPDRELLRAVRAPVIIISMEGDPIHPVAAGEALAEVLPNAELLVFPNQEELLGEIPTLVTRAQEFLS